MQASPAVFAVDEKVLVGDNQHQAYVARPVREGDDTVLVRWESTKKEEEVAVGDVKKIDLEAKRPRRKRRDASAAETEASAPAQREPPRKRRKKKALPSAHESLHEEIERHLKTLQSGDAYSKKAGVEALEKLAIKKNLAPIAQRLVELLSGGSADGKDAAAAALAKLTGGWHQTAARTAAIAEAGGIPPLVALVRNFAADGQAEAAQTLGRLADNNAANQAAITKAGGIEALVALVRSGDADSRRAAVRALEELAREDANCTAIAQRLVGLLSGGSSEDQEEAAADAMSELAYSADAMAAAIAAAGGIESLVALATNGAAGGREEAAHALKTLVHNNDANRAAIVPALLALVANGTAHRQKRAAWVLATLGCDGAVPPLVALVTNGAAGGQEAAAEALGWLADDTWGKQHYFGMGPRPTDDAVNCVAIAAAGGIEALVALVRSGAAGGQATAALALQYLAKNNAVNKAAIVAAGGVEALVALLLNGSDRCKSNAKWALTELPIAEYVSRLRSENASLKRQLAGDDVVDLRDGDASPPAKKRNALRDAHDEQQAATLNHVKQENVVVEGQRDRTDATAAEASAAAAKASADAATANGDAEEAQDTLGYQVRFTDALQTKIDELHALASQVDPVAADAIKNRPN